MQNHVQAMFREQVLQRRERLEAAIHQAPGRTALRALLSEVDAALARLDNGRFGLCESCQDPIESDRLLADPLVRQCLDHLTPAQSTAVDRDLDLARRVQLGLLPALPVDAGRWEMAYEYRPAGVVSGDYCDMVRGTSGDTFFLFGDVAGKGVAASMLMTQLHGMFRALIAAGFPLAQLVERASRIFCESTLPTHYATLVAVRALGDGTVEVCNAGHVPPLVALGGVVSYVQAGSVPIGMFCSAAYQVTTLVLAPGDQLVLVTDGVSEAENAEGQQYGLERVGNICRARIQASAPELSAAILRDVDGYRSGPMADDTTVMVVRRT